MKQSIIQFAIDHWFLTSAGAAAVISTAAKLWPTEHLKSVVGPVCYTAGRAMTLGGNARLRGFWEPVEQYFTDGVEVVAGTAWSEFKRGLKSDNAKEAKDVQS